MDCSKADNGNWRTAYRALERLYASGRARAIGVSNFNRQQLEDLFEFASVRLFLAPIAIVLVFST
jgi:diketogulonate reductase-like aldo/keto reductase